MKHVQQVHFHKPVWSLRAIKAMGNRVAPLSCAIMSGLKVIRASLPYTPESRIGAEFFGKRPFFLDKIGRFIVAYGVVVIVYAMVVVKKAG